MSYPFYSSSYRMNREPGGITYYTSSYVVPTYFTPSRSYTYTVPTRSYSYTLPGRTSYYTLPARTTYYSYGPSTMPTSAGDRVVRRVERVVERRTPVRRYYRYI